MSQEIVNDLVELIGMLADCDRERDGVVIVPRDSVVEMLRGIIQEEWMRTGILGAVE